MGRIQTKTLLLSVFIVLIFVQGCYSEQKNDYNDIVSQIQKNVKDPQSPLHHAAYNRLANLSDSYGPRLWGSPQLEMFISDLSQQAKDLNIDTYLEPVVDFTKWVRGREELWMLSPRRQKTKLALIGLGRSVSGNVTAEAIVVTDFNDLERQKSHVAGKIVVYCQEWIDYDTTVQYRSSGASRASKYGAVAALVRSVTPFSIESPHTGGQTYDPRYRPIPVAAITVEDAYMFKRMQDRGQKIVLNLFLENQSVRGASSNNLIAEVKGSSIPDEIVLFGGHMDSWDTGTQTGANDDGGGVLTCFEALRVLHHLNLVPKRTLRMIGWSGEEYGGAQSGAFQYAKAHAFEANKHILAFESDEGSTKPFGYGFTGSDEATKIITDIATKYFSPINCTFVRPGDGGMVDTGPLGALGIPMMRNLIWDLNDQLDFYFTFHHSAGDSITMMNPDAMDDNVIAIAAMMYIVADLDDPLPRAAADVPPFQGESSYDKIMG